MVETDKGGWKIVVMTIFFGFFFLLVYGLMILDEKTMTNRSIEDRTVLLEKQMKDKIRPVIQINRATVYNTDGEIIIETIEIKKEKKK